MCQVKSALFVETKIDKTRLTQWSLRFEIRIEIKLRDIHRKKIYEGENEECVYS